MNVDDLTCYHVLHGLSSILLPQSYLEIGVREGASLCCVLAEEKEIVPFIMKCLVDGRTYITDDIVERIRSFTPRNRGMNLFLFENWSYDGAEGGEKRLEQLLLKGFAHIGKNVEVHCGDSRIKVPQFFEGHTGKIDLVFVDGDHSWEVAEADLENLYPHFKVLVFHDLYHPQHGYLHRLFKQYVEKYGLPHFTVGGNWMGTGVAFNLR